MVVGLDRFAAHFANYRGLYSLHPSRFEGGTWSDQKAAAIMARMKASLPCMRTAMSEVFPAWLVAAASNLKGGSG